MIGIAMNALPAQLLSRAKKKAARIRQRTAMDAANHRLDLAALTSASTSLSWRRDSSVDHASFHAMIRSWTCAGYLAKSVGAGNSPDQLPL